MHEKDNHLVKAYNKIANLSMKIGSIQGHMKEKDEEIRRVKKENIELRE